MLKRRHFIAASAAACLPAIAQIPGFSGKPIRIEVPFGPGGVADLTARAIAQKLSENLHQGVIVENKPGAGGIVAAEAVAHAEPDGHTLLLMSNGTAVSAGLSKSLPFDPQKDFAPIATLGFFDIAVLESAKGRFASLQEMLAFAKAHPGKLNVATINIGSTQHLAAELLKTSAGVDFQVVPFNGTPAVITALQSGQVDAAVEIIAPVMGQITANAVRPLAVMAAHRSPTLPEVPTVAESGVPGFDVASWNALAAPARTPPEVVAFLNREVLKVLASPDVRKQLAALNVTARGSTPEQLKALLGSEIKRWTDVIQRAKVPRQ